MFVQSSYQGAKIDKGELYLVCTPIGNLGDMSSRAVEILKMVDLIAAEDTRHTRKLLAHFQFEAKLVSHHEHNKEASIKGLIELLESGKKVALVSDAGMPAISDPGYELVREAVEMEISVIPIPGPNAALSALIASGLPTGKFFFLGFLPREKKQLREELERLKPYPETLILYEAPHRIDKMLKEAKEILGNRRAVLARELTKKHEEFIRGTLEEVINYLDEGGIRGEFTILIEGNLEPDLGQTAAGSWWNHLSSIEHVDKYIAEGMSSKEAIKKVAEDRKVPKREIYNQYHGE
ncbi:MAG TPA: 16S rRNA (cytidine(1402)-2'-O)-methyltransferase [Bacillota bacterium]|nr:16S rRNA (cytidine(1402)-2'-O)-methyltransferase [Bacillota bacterium]